MSKHLIEGAIQMEDASKAHSEDQGQAEEDDFCLNEMHCLLQMANTDSSPLIKDLPATVSSYKDAQRLVQDAYVQQIQINKLYSNFRFAYLKARHELLALQPRCESANQYYQDVLRVVGASGYDVTLVGGKQPKIAVSQKSSTKTSVTSVGTKGRLATAAVVLD